MGAILWSWSAAVAGVMLLPVPGAGRPKRLLAPACGAGSAGSCCSTLPSVKSSSKSRTCTGLYACAVAAPALLLLLLGVKAPVKAGLPDGALPPAPMDARALLCRSAMRRLLAAPPTRPPRCTAKAPWLRVAPAFSLDSRYSAPSSADAAKRRFGAGAVLSRSAALRFLLASSPPFSPRGVKAE